VTPGGFEFVKLPDELVARLDDPAQHELEYDCEHVHAGHARKYGTPLINALADAVQALLPQPVWIASRHSLVTNANFAYDWHQDFRHIVSSKERAAQMRFAIYVAGEPRCEFRAPDGAVVPLPYGYLGLFDGLTWHKRARGGAGGPRWCVRLAHFPEGNPKRRAGNSDMFARGPKDTRVRVPGCSGCGSRSKR